VRSAAIFCVGLALAAWAGCGTPSSYRTGGAPAESESGNESGVAAQADETETSLDVAGVGVSGKGEAAPASRPARMTRASAAASTAAPTTAPADEPARARSPVLLYTATLTMAVFDVEPGLKAVEATARDLGGFLARQTNTAITVRVPAARFHEALGRLEKLGDVTGRNIQAEDVTQEYLDLELRIKSARSVRERLEQLLGRASKVEESIAIERELERVMAEVERMEGRLKYLRDRAQFSTITVNFASRPKELVAKDTFKLPFPWLDQLGLGRLLELR
jgi:hypothetical protein